MAAAAAAAVPAVPRRPAGRCRAKNARCGQLECLREFTAKELEFVSSFKSGELNVQAGTSILLQGTNSAHLYTVCRAGRSATNRCRTAAGKF